MEPKYKIVTKNDFSRLGRFCDFDEVFEKLAEMSIDAGFHVVEVDSGKDVTGEFKECMAEGGFVFAEELEKEINGRLMEIMSKKTYTGYKYEGRAGEIIALRAYQYVSHFQEILANGFIFIGQHDNHSILCERNNKNSPVYKYKTKDVIPNERYEKIRDDSTILEESVEIFLNKIEFTEEKRNGTSQDKQTGEKEKSIEIEESDRIDFDVKMATKYKGRLYSILCFKYRGVEFIYAPKVLAERINEEQDFGTEILDEVTYFITPKQMDEMYEILRKTPSWKKFSNFCASNGINCDFIWYYPLDDSEEFEGWEYPTVEFFCNGTKCIYTTEKAFANDNFVEYLSDRDSASISSATKKSLKEMEKFFSEPRLYQEFDRFCKDNGIPNIIPEQDFEEGDKGFDFDTSEYRKAQERKNLPEGYGEDDEETLEISEAEYGRLSQTLDRFLAKKNPRWCKDGVVEERFAEFCENVRASGICGHIWSNIKRCDDEIKNFEFCKNNNALVHEQFRNVSRFQNALQDAIKCSNNVYTDFLNIKDLATALMDEESVSYFLDEYNEFMEKEYPAEESKIEDYTLRNRYKIEGTGKTVLERVTFSSLESAFDAVYAMDIKPPFKVIDLETREDATGKVMEIAEGQNHMFIDTEEIIKRLPDSFEKFKKGAYSWEYLDKKDGKQIKCLNRVNFKHITGFKDLWRRNCVPFGFKRNFILFADLTQPSAPIYRIDYRRTADFESRRLLNESFEDYFSRIPNDWEN